MQPPEGPHEVQGKAEIHRHGDSRQSKPDEDRDHVPGDGGQKVSSLALQLGALYVRRVEVSAAGIGVQT